MSKVNYSFRNSFDLSIANVVALCTASAGQMSSIVEIEKNLNRCNRRKKIRELYHNASAYLVRVVVRGLLLRE